MNHQINILFDYKLINIADYDVCFCRLMSQLAGVNIQSSVGMFSFYVALLADRTIGRAFGTACRLSVCRLSVCRL